MRKLRKVLDKEPYVAFYSCSLSDTGLRTCLWESLDQVNWVAVTHLGCRWHHSQAQGLWMKSELSAASWLWKQSEQLGVSSFSATMTLLPWWTWILNQNKPFLKLNLQTCCSSNAESDQKKSPVLRRCARRMPQSSEGGGSQGPRNSPWKRFFFKINILR